MTISTTGLSRHPSRADQPGSPGLFAVRSVRLAAAVAGAVALGAYLYVALSRVGYRFALEWLEGNSLVEVRRILSGQQLYAAPGRATSLTGTRRCTCTFGWFWTALLSAMGMAAAAVALGARRVPREVLAGCAALAVEGYAALAHSGGGINDVLPAYLAVALLAGLALGHAGTPGGPGAAPGPASRWTCVAPAVLVLAQTLLLLSGFRPAQQIPAPADRAVGENLLSGLRALGGTTAIPADPGLSVLAGQEPAAHQDAAYDVLRASGQGAAGRFRASVAEAVAARRFSAIITDDPGPPPGYPADLGRYYRRCPQPLLADTPAVLFRPVAGAPVRPRYVWLPLNSGRSCNEAAGLLDGTVKEDYP